MTEGQKIFYRVLQLYMKNGNGSKFPRVKVMRLFFFYYIYIPDNYFQYYFGNSFFPYPTGPVNERLYIHLKSPKGDKIFRDLCFDPDSFSDYPINDSEVVRIFKDSEFYFKKLSRMPVDELVELSCTTESWRNSYLYSPRTDLPMSINSVRDRVIVSEFLDHFLVI